MDLLPLTEEEARELIALSKFREAFGGSLNGKEFGLIFRRCRELVGLPEDPADSVFGELKRD